MARGYSSYRGRRSKWKILLAAVLALIILAAIGIMVMQRFVVYDDMGSPQLSLPGAEQTTPVKPQPGEVDITIETDPTVEESTPPAELPVTILQLSDDPALWGQTLSVRGEEAFCISVKSSGGKLRYPFAAGAAGQLRGDHAGVAEALQPLLHSDYYAVARLSCLRDGSVARANVETMGLKNTGGFIFYDGNNENWLDPSKEATRAYLAALVEECAELGFDEILLTDLSYPTEGKLDKIAYGAPDAETQAAWTAEQIAGLLAAVKEALGERNVKLSLEISQSAAENGGVDMIAGVNLPDVLAEHLDRVYVPTTAEKALSLPAQIGGVALVPELAALPVGGSIPAYLLQS